MEASSSSSSSSPPQAPSGPADNLGEGAAPGQGVLARGTLEDLGVGLSRDLELDTLSPDLWTDLSGGSGGFCSKLEKDGGGFFFQTNECRKDWLID